MFTIFSIIHYVYCVMEFHNLEPVDLFYIYVSSSRKILTPQEREHKGLTVLQVTGQHMSTDIWVILCLKL